ncbi:hypothetical protein D9M70_647860 [compost metagenome]
MHAKQQQVQGDVIEHDAGEDFIGVEVRAQPGRQPSPCGTGQGPGEQDQDQCPATLQLDDIHRQRTAGQGAEQQLAFGADVPDSRLVRNGQAQRAEQNR